MLLVGVVLDGEGEELGLFVEAELEEAVGENDAVAALVEDEVRGLVGVRLGDRVRVVMGIPLVTSNVPANVLRSSVIDSSIRVSRRNQVSISLLPCNVHVIGSRILQSLAVYHSYALKT